MQISLSALAVVVLCGQTPEVSFQTPNFVVSAPTPEIAKLVGDSAERWRTDLARLWLGKELAAWASPCQIDVTLSMDVLEGFSAVSFTRGCVATQKMSVKGPVDRILKGPLPHELTHILFAHHFGAQPPRWADEGGAMLSEGARQAARQSTTFRQILAAEKLFSLRRLLEMRQYPDDVACLYAQSHALARFLVDAKGNKAFLAFVGDGVERGWDEAVRQRYGFTNVEQMETAWLGWVARQPEFRDANVVGRATPKPGAEVPASE